MTCAICNCENILITYKGKIRNGSIGSMTKDEVLLFRCSNCNIIWHHPILNYNFYESDSYRNIIGETVSLPEFYSRHDAEILDKLFYTGTKVYRNKVFMDIGCGGGGYADYINGVARQIILIEPNENFASKLRDKGYEVYAYSDDAINKYENHIDLITSYDVIEHVDKPYEFLLSVYRLLAPGGCAFIGTPTEYPILRELLGTEFDKFVFSVQHLWVFSRNNLEYMSHMCGFSKINIKYYQRFGIGNLIAWLQTRKPQGEAIYSFISSSLDSLYKKEMAKEQTAEYIVLELQK